MRSETIYSRLFSLVFSRQGSTHKKGQNTHGNLSRLQSKQRRQLNSSLWYFLKEEKPSPSKSIATPVSRTRSCHNGVYLGSNDRSPLTLDLKHLPMPTFRAANASRRKRVFCPVAPSLPPTLSKLSYESQLYAQK